MKGEERAYRQILYRFTNKDIDKALGLVPSRERCEEEEERQGRGKRGGEERRRERREGRREQGRERS